MENNEKVANINVNIKSFFRKWIQFTEPFHKLRLQQQNVLALMLYYHYELKKEITNNKVLWKEVFDYDTKIKISTELNIQQSALENVLTQLRKKGVVENNKIVNAYIPNITNKTPVFTIKYNFKITYE